MAGNDGYPFWSFWDNLRSWWAVRELSNVMLLHFAELKRDMPGNIRKIADFLEIEVDEQTWPAILEHCSFDYMKTHMSNPHLGRASGMGGRVDFYQQGHQWLLA